MEWNELQARVKRFHEQRPVNDVGPGSGVLVDSGDCLTLLADLRDLARETADDPAMYENDVFDLIARGLDVVLRSLPYAVE